MVALTKQQKLKKITNDFELFAKNFIKIVDNEGNLVNFNLNDAQKEIFKIIKDNRYTAIDKSRQAGITTFALAYALYLAVTEPNSNCVIYSYKEKSSIELMEKVRSMNDNLPRDKWDIFPKTIRNSRDGLVFENGSTVVCQTAGSKDIGRGNTYRFIHITELAFWGDIDRQLLALEQALMKGSKGRIVIETTANGLNEWYELYSKAVKGNSKYKAYFLPSYHKLYSKQFKGEYDLAEQWYKSTNGGKRLTFEDLEDDEKLIYEKSKNYRFLMWRRWKLLDMELEEFQQEYPTNYAESFISNDGQVFNQRKILERMDNALKPINILDNVVVAELSKYLKKGLTIYHLPIKNERYYAGVDVASGNGGDYSTMTILNRNGEEVATFSNNKLAVWEFTKVVNMLGNFYNYSFIAIERNNVGITLIERLRNEYKYLNLFKEKTFDMKGKKKLRLGWTTSAINKPILIQDYKEAFERGNILIHNIETLEQMTVFTEKDGKTGNAGASTHDDLVISSALAVQGMKAGKWYV